MPEPSSLRLPALADIQSAQSEYQHIALNWVGMEQIDLPLEFEGRPVMAKVNAGINLLNNQHAAKGIHMSRLYMQLDDLTQGEVTPGAVQEVLKAFLRSHEGQSSEASLSIKGELLLSRKSLISNYYGWKAYPIELTATLSEACVFHIKVGIPYASTCPNSAALSRQSAQVAFQRDFEGQEDNLTMEAVNEWLGTKGMPATPHSQRSWAWIEAELNTQATQFPFRQLIDAGENALGTAVQTVVKRGDEQAFAQACGSNLMFCEDAARRLHQRLLKESGFAGFSIRVEHQESLHAHNAVARVRFQGVDHVA